MSPHRVKVEIDEHSWVETYHSDRISDVVVFIHGILGDYVETWGSTPDQLKGERQLADFDFGSFGYRTTVLDRREPIELASQLILWLRTHMSHYESIFLVTHSMGGLIARIACGRLAKSKYEDERLLFSKIKHCFFVAVPVSGSWAARLLGSIPGLKQINRKIPFLANPTVDGEDIAAFYRHSIALAKVSNLSRPRFSHFLGTEDGIVLQPEEGDLTEDDRFEGHLPGNHGSIKLDTSANSTLIRRICQCIEQRAHESNVGTRGGRSMVADVPAAKRNLARADRKSVRDVVLIPCCATKETADGGLHPLSGGIREGVDDTALADAIVEARVHIKRLIESGSLEGSEFKEGNRALRAPNRRLYLGPDFGGAVNKARYLPAYRRYIGRCYQALPEDWDRFFELPEAQRPDVLIVSGLYGVYPAGEYIQNYDVHLTDLDVRKNCTLQEMWRPLLTQVLLSRLAWLERGGYTIGRVFDLLTEDLYRAVFDWERVRARYPVLRQTFLRRSGREALDNAGIWLKNIVNSPVLLQDVKEGEIYEDSEFLDHDEMRFDTLQPRS